MRKILLCIATSVIAMGAVAQQWSGSSTTSGTINRTGTVQILPTQNAKPYIKIDSTIQITEKYNSQYPEGRLSLSHSSIYLSYLVPSGTTDASIIRRGEFTFNHYIGSNNKFFTLTKNGILSTNCKINSTDSILASNIKVSNLIQANKITTPALTINGTSNPTNFKFGVVGKSYFSDFVGIGTSNLTFTSGFKLAVKGGILCEEVKVIANVPSADYVFEKDYKLHSIEEVAEYVKENKHLPDVPSAKDFKENGYKIGDMDNLLLQKIEELTLYIIEQQKQIKELQSRLSE
ncbi:MAG: hypothetical protein MJ197_03430 [Bacteroidales bacterium]|nr:hypothetical protein [Bacteroidales bacterium]